MQNWIQRSQTLKDNLKAATQVQSAKVINSTKVLLVKGRTISTNFTAKVKSHAREVNKIESKKRKKLLLAGIAFGFINLAYSVFSLYTLISFILMICGIVIYFKLNLAEIKKKGLISYLPGKYQKMLLHRSLFDIICDFWFVPRISLYIKAFVTPFIFKIEPSEAINQLKDFPPATRKAILTKGVVNTLPSFLQDIMLPQTELITEDSSDVSSANEDHEEIVDNKDILVNGHETKSNDELVKEVLSNDAMSNKSTSAPTDTLSLQKLDSNHTHSGLLHTSTDDDGFVNHNFSLSKQLEFKKTLPSFADISPMKVHLDYRDWSQDKNRLKSLRYKGKVPSNKTGPKIGKTFLHDSEGEPKSKILNSNKIVDRRAKNKAVVSETWDKLELFARKHREKLLNQRLNPHTPPKKIELKGPLQMLQNIAFLLNKDALMNKLEDKKVMKIFLVSSLALLLQFSISKKTRYWCYNTLHILMYITGFTLSTGSVAILMVKMKKKYQQWKLKEKMEVVKELTEGEEDEKSDN